MNYCVPGRKLLGRVRDDEHGTWRTYHDTPRTPLERVRERPDHDVPAAVKARLRVQVEAIDLLALHAAEERQLIQLLQTRGRAQLAANLIATTARRTRRAQRHGGAPRANTRATVACRADPSPELVAAQLRSGSALTPASTKVRR